ncbi:MAG: TolC family protein, partial [Prevotella sp.]|nr:TolC family protein [Prevotella sp.]
MLLATLSSATAQKVLTLEECRDLALRNNKQLGVAGMKKEVAGNLRKAARTKYLPKVDAVGGYEFFSREISILSNDQKTAFSQLGTSMMTNMGGSISSALVGLAQHGAITPDFAKQLGTVVTQLSEPLALAGNQLGQKINDALRTDTRNVWAGAIVLRQPIYMGGAITAANRMADINEQLVANQQDGVRQ